MLISSITCSLAGSDLTTRPPRALSDLPPSPNTETCLDDVNPFLLRGHMTLACRPPPVRHKRTVRSPNAPFECGDVTVRWAGSRIPGAAGWTCASVSPPQPTFPPPLSPICLISSLVVELNQCTRSASVVLVEKRERTQRVNECGRWRQWQMGSGQRQINRGVLHPSTRIPPS